ncbi:MAG: thiamine pyrophosphate-dependent enzyme [Bacteroidota bacterium]|nr:thiamine pyrophosphate-dependent enzyme [Bacteroidota bacterium]
MDFDRTKISKKKLIDLYESMLIPRLIEEKMIVLLKQGKISKWFSGIGQEAISVGVTKAIRDDEYVLPMHRNLGVFTSRGIPLYNLFCQWQGKIDGFTKGRDRSFHFGAKENHIIGMISHLGPQMGMACGISLGHLLKKEKKLCVVMTGDGGTSEGDFHEALNVASVWKLPVIFCIENNGYGISTPAKEQYAIENLVERGIGYGIESFMIEGNNVLEVYKNVSNIAKDIRSDPRPIIIEFKTFRMRGHEESSGQEYVSQQELDTWSKKDPVIQFENYLLEEKLIKKDKCKEFRSEYSKLIDNEWVKSELKEEIVFNESNELSDVFKTLDLQVNKASNKSSNIRFVDAISQAIHLCMEEDRDLIIMGQDIAEYGGVFKVTKGMSSTFGKERVRNTPLCESVVLSASMGLSILKIPSIVEMQFSDFVSSGFTAIVNLISKSYYRWGQNASIVIRMPCGGGVGAGPFHSQTNESWFTTVPGLKVVYPSFPKEAKGLLINSIKDPNPVLFFEHKKLYRTITEDVPSDSYITPFGKAIIRAEGNDMCIITYGLGVHWALEEVKKFPGAAIAVLDINTLVPLDYDSIFDLVKKTGKVLLLQEDSRFGGFMGEIAAEISEKCFEYLDAPIFRLASLNTPIPFTANLEEGYFPKRKLNNNIKTLLEY